MKEFNLPDLGEGLQEAEIVAWHVGEGDNVVTDQPLVSVETDKAVVEVPSPCSGKITKIHGEEGDVVEVGMPLVSFAEGEAKDAGTVVGKQHAGEVQVQEASVEVETKDSRKAGKATPVVRALAQKLGVDLAMVTPTGQGNVITAKDVEAAAADVADAEPLEPLKGVRRAMARRMAHANSEVAATTIMEDADIGDWKGDQDISMRLMRAMAAGCKAEPMCNAWYDSSENGLRVHKKIDLGIAVNTDAGLFVPVMHDIGNRTSDDLRKGFDELRAAVEARTVPADELRGATITLTNAGPLLGHYTTPIVSPPQVAILGVCRARDEVVARDGQPVVRRMMPLSMTFDHRAVSGAEASNFMATVITDLALSE